jgi:hypothetical protein
MVQFHHTGEVVKKVLFILVSLIILAVDLQLRYYQWRNHCHHTQRRDQHNPLFFCFSSFLTSQVHPKKRNVWNLQWSKYDTKYLHKSRLDENMIHTKLSTYKPNFSSNSFLWAYIFFFKFLGESFHLISFFVINIHKTGWGIFIFCFFGSLFQLEIDKDINKEFWQCGTYWVQITWV